VENRLKQYDCDSKKALASLKKVPIYLDKGKSVQLEFATCIKDEYVIKYNVDTNFNKADSVIDTSVREILQNRLKKFGARPRRRLRMCKAQIIN